MTFLIIIDGPMGAGKTMVAEALFKKVKNVSIIKLDQIKRFYSDFDRNRDFGLGLASAIGVSMTKVIGPLKPLK